MSKYLLKPFYHQDHCFQVYASPVKHGQFLLMEFMVEGQLDRLFLPRYKPENSNKRVIGLWESTCFEFFIKHKDREDYLEFNLSSDHHWNAFYFKYIRDQVKEFEPIDTIHVHSKREKWGLEITCKVDLTKFPDHFWESGNMRMGITAITEDKLQKKEYWALNHLDENPYFHNPHTFLVKDF